MIDFTRAFNSAWERMVIILFRPFDLGKWFVIGFSAFLAGLLDGGNGYNGGYNGNIPDASHNQNHTWWQAPSHGVPSPEVVRLDGVSAPHLPVFAATGPALPNFNLPHMAATYLASLSIVLIILFGIAILGLVIVIYWLGARGQFLFLDNIVRNRGAISWPWVHYARQGNSLFFFVLLYVGLVFGIAFLTALGGFVAYPLLAVPHMVNMAAWIVCILLGLAVLVLLIAICVVFFIFASFGVPLMFRHGLMAWAAFMESMRLLRDWPGSIAIFVLLRFALWLAVIVLSLVTCCFTCCIALIPYVGTVILLPALIFVRCFTLDCLAQFGPRYDVWNVDAFPGDPGTPPVFNPLQPRG